MHYLCNICVFVYILFLFCPARGAKKAAAQTLCSGLARQALRRRFYAVIPGTKLLFPGMIFPSKESVKFLYFL